MSTIAPTPQQKPQEEQVVYLPDGRRVTAGEVLQTWRKRVTDGLEARAPYEPQWRLNEAFAAGNQWLRIDETGRSTRALEDVRAKLRADGRSVLETDVLTQYLMTAIGKLAADDFRPQLLAARTGEETRQATGALNDLYGWGWDEEWRGDDGCMDILDTIAVYGTCGVRCRVDRSKGMFLGSFPHPAEPYKHPPTGQTFPANRPILDHAAAAAYVGDRAQYGEPTNIRPVREPRIVWETFTPWGMIPPPGVENSEDFPYDLIGRAVHVDVAKAAYPDKASMIRAEPIEATGVLGTVAPFAPGAIGTQLKDHVLMYSGYLKPTIDHPAGQTIVWCGNVVLELEEGLPYTSPPRGPRPGITYFRYWKVKRRFFGRALIEPGIGAQRVRNKRVSQSDEIIDRGLPKTYVEEGAIPDATGAPMELIVVAPGTQKPVIDRGVAPGEWMQESIQQCDSDIQQALGLHNQSVGAESAPGTPYASLALQAENDQTKLGPIVTRFKSGVADLVRDSVEAMHSWPPGKRMMIEGDDGLVRELTYQHAMVPDAYLVKPAKGGGVPRSQGAELQKIADLWGAAVAAQAVMQNPIEWLTWYKNSLDAGQAQELPEMDGKAQQQHKAALENVIMVRLMEVVPVAPFDDATVHIPVHDQQQAQLSQAAMLGDDHASAAVQVIEQHKQMHLAQQAQAQNAAPGLPPGMAPPGPPPAAGPPGALPLPIAAPTP